MSVDTATMTKVDALRAQLPAVQKLGYFNTGTYGPIPVVAQQAAQAVLERELEQGRIIPSGYEINRGRNRRLAALAADVFGADPDEIALTHSACEGLNSALMGMTWQRGDEIVTTGEEHPGLLLPLSLMAHRFGTITRFADISDASRSVTEAIAQQITPRTRVIALSHVMWSTGAVLPLGEICQLARERGLMVVVDAAQSAGNVPVDLHRLGVDAYAMAGQKWLCGPESTGFLFVRRDRFADIAPTFARYGQFESSGYFLPGAGATRYEIGEFSGSVIAAQEASLNWLRDEVVMDWAYAQILANASEFHRRLSALDGVAVMTPELAMAGLVNFSVDGMTPQDVVTAVYDRGFIIRSVDTRPCTVSARASVGWWNTDEEIAGITEAIAEIAASAKARAN